MKFYLFLQIVKIRLDVFGFAISSPGRLRLKTLSPHRLCYLWRAIPSRTVPPGSGSSVSARSWGRIDAEEALSRAQGRLTNT